MAMTYKFGTGTGGNVSANTIAVYCDNQIANEGGSVVVKNGTADKVVIHNRYFSNPATYKNSETTNIGAGDLCVYGYSGIYDASYLMFHGTVGAVGNFFEVHVSDPEDSDSALQTQFKQTESQIELTTSDSWNGQGKIDISPGFVRMFSKEPAMQPSYVQVSSSSVGTVAQNNTQFWTRDDMELYSQDGRIIVTADSDGIYLSGYTVLTQATNLTSEGYNVNVNADYNINLISSYGSIDVQGGSSATFRSNGLTTVRGNNMTVSGSNVNCYAISGFTLTVSGATSSSGGASGWQKNAPRMQIMTGSNSPTPISPVIYIGIIKASGGTTTNQLIDIYDPYNLGDAYCQYYSGKTGANGFTIAFYNGNAYNFGICGDASSYSPSTALTSCSYYVFAQQTYIDAYPTAYTFQPVNKSSFRLWAGTTGSNKQTIAGTMIMIVGRRNC